MHDESVYAERSLRAGALGYVTKQELGEQVLVAIRCVLRSETYLSPRISVGVDPA
jgi:DNA-binding NarL/FixJ family response regulator